jgi:hypothetical protein
MGADFWNAFMASGFTAAFAVCLWGIRVLVRLDKRVEVIEAILRVTAESSADRRREFPK